MTYSWNYNPGMGTHFLMGPWVAPDGRVDPKEQRQYGHILDPGGMVYWACLNPNETPEKFFDLEEAKAFLLASVVLR